MKCYHSLGMLSIIIVILLSGCNSTTPPSITKPTLPTPIHITKTTISSTIHLTPTQTPIAVVDVIWANELKQVANLSSPDGQWAPTENTYAYELKDNDSLADASLQQATAPLFKPLTITDKFSYDDVFTWQPNGQTILLHSVIPEDTNFGISARRIWMVGVDGKNPHAISPKVGGPFFLTFVGSMDDQTIVVDSFYPGGGHSIVSAVNISTGNSLNLETLIHGEVFLPSNGYIPATSDTGNADPHLMVISDRFPEQNYKRAEGHFKLLPQYKNFPIDNTLSQFEDWWGNTNKILVFWGYFEDWKPKGDTNLMLWDVDKNSLRLLAPGGVGGKFSPDGKYLAYMTFASALLDKTMKSTDTPARDGENQPRYLQLLDMNSDKIILSLPSFSYWADDDYIFHKHQSLQAKFSLDSRYLAFITPGKLETDVNYWPLKVVDDLSHEYVNILDIQNKQIIWSALSTKKTELSWSPDNEHLLFQNQDQNWFLFSTSNKNLIPITKDHGSVAIKPAWSYDGHYFSFNICTPLDNNVSCRLIKTVIFDTIN